MQHLKHHNKQSGLYNTPAVRGSDASWCVEITSQEFMSNLDPVSEGSSR